MKIFHFWLACNVPCIIFLKTPRPTWVLQWPGQVTIAGCQTFWTKEVSEALEAGDLSTRLFPQLSAQVGKMTEYRQSLDFPALRPVLIKKSFYLKNHPKAKTWAIDAAESW